ncbi:MAG: thioesterase family protein [Acidobacteriota bacterium]
MTAAGNSAPSAPFVETIAAEVRYAETDQMGVVHHAVYPIWFELARTALCKRSGLSYAEVEQLGYFLMVTAVNVRYRRGAHYGDVVEVGCVVERAASRGLTFAYSVRRRPKGGDDANKPGPLLASGTTEHIWVARESGRPTRPPAALQTTFERLVTPADALGG